MSVMSLGEPIAGTGNLYAWGEGQILKLYGDDVPAGWVEHIGKVERACMKPDCLSLQLGKSLR